MIDIHYWPTPNGKKVTILLEELGVDYRIIPCDIGRGDQFNDEFLDISPNNRMPAMVDHDPVDGGEPVALFESGVIMMYIAEKEDRFFPQDTRDKNEVIQWIMWQMANQGPMCGQAGHFRNYAPEKIEYPIERYTNEAHRLYRVLDTRLADREFVAGEFSMADILCWPWIHMREHHGQNFEAFPQLERWYEQLLARPAFARGLAVGLDLLEGSGGMDEEARRNLFGQR